MEASVFVKRISSLSDAELITKLDSLVANERNVCAAVLAHMARSMHDSCITMTVIHRSIVMQRDAWDCLRRPLAIESPPPASFGGGQSP